MKMDEMSGKRTQATSPFATACKPKSHSRPRPINVGDPNRTAVQRKDMWENLHQAMQRLGKCRSYKELLFKLPGELGGIIECDKMSIMLLGSCFSDTVENEAELAKEGVLVKRLFMNGAWHKLIHGANHQPSNPQYSNFGQLAVGRKR